MVTAPFGDYDLIYPNVLKRPMRPVLAVLTSILLGFAPGVWAQQGPVVVELYTSQGCSSCPPADAILTELAKRDDVIALALHVDYWDYLGWKDNFGDANFSRRQRAYAAAAGQHTVYTPQMVVQGISYAVGNQENDVRRAIAMHRDDPSPVDLQITRQGNRLAISATALKGGNGRMVIQLVRYVPQQVVKIRGGENAGREIVYSNIVTHWAPITRWNGEGVLTTTIALTGSDRAVVLVQRDGFGPIVAAKLLK